MSLKNLSLFCFLFLALCSCYRMPTDDDFSTVPTTNNPDVTGSKKQSATPGVNL